MRQGPHNRVSFFKSRRRFLQQASALLPTTLSGCLLGETYGGASSGSAGSDGASAGADAGVGVGVGGGTSQSLAGAGTQSRAGGLSASAAPRWAGQFQAELTGSARATFASRVTSPSGAALSFGATRVPEGWQVTRDGSVAAPATIPADEAPLVTSLWADDGLDPGEIVGIDAFGAVAGTSLLYCGQYVRDGDVPAGQTLKLFLDGAEIPSQCSVGMRDYASGARRFFKIRALAKLPAGTVKHVSVRPSASGYSGPARTLAAFASAAPDAQVTVTGDASGTFTLASALAQSSNVFLEEGPVCCEVITASQQVAGSLRIEWHAVHTGGGSYGFRVRIASGSINNADKTKYAINIAVRAGGTTVATATSATIWPDSSGWVFAAPDGGFHSVGGLLVAGHLLDADYLVATGIVPSLMWRDYTDAEKDNSHRTDMGFGAPYIRTHDPLGTYRGTSASDSGRVNDISMNAGHGGHEDDIGIFQRWFLLGLFMRDWNNYTTTRINAIADRYQIQQREPGTLVPADPAAAGRAQLSWQDYSIVLRSAYDTRQAATSSGYFPASHVGDDYGAYVMFGDPWMVRELQYQATHNHWHQNPHTRWGRRDAQGLLQGWSQARALGWGLRTLVRAWLCTPSGTLAPWLDASLLANIDDLNATIGSNPLHLPKHATIADTAGRVIISSLNLSWYSQGVTWATTQSLPLATGYAAKLGGVADDVAVALESYCGTVGTTFPYQHIDLYQPRCEADSSNNPIGSWASAWTLTRGLSGFTDPTGPDFEADSYYTLYTLQAIALHAGRGRSQSKAALLRAMQARNLGSTLNDGSNTARRRQVTFTLLPFGVIHGA